MKHFFKFETNILLKISRFLSEFDFNFFKKLINNKLVFILYIIIRSFEGNKIQLKNISYQMKSSEFIKRKF
jgi:hypothetical protein